MQDPSAPGGSLSCTYNEQVDYYTILTIYNSIQILSDMQESMHKQKEEVVSRHRMRRGGINVLHFNGLSALASLLHDILDLHD